MRKQLFVLAAIMTTLATNLLPAKAMLGVGNQGTPVVTKPAAKVAFTRSNLQQLGGLAFNIDDANGSAFINALPLFNQAGIKTSIAVIGLGNTKYDGGSGYYASDSQIKEASKQGHLIASHGMNHLDSTKPTAVELDFELRASKRYLQNLIGLQVNHFVAPECAMDSKTLNSVKKFYSIVSLCGLEGNSTTKLNPLGIDRKMIDSNTSLAQVKTWIMEAKNNKQLLVLTIHHVGYAGQDDQNISTAMLKSVIDSALNSGMPIGTTEAAVKLLK
jgi:peptidoglycan/xylan/chitin deacetylase (PgdA/CDA1 family)